MTYKPINRHAFHYSKLSSRKCMPPPPNSGGLNNIELPSVNSIYLGTTTGYIPGEPEPIETDMYDDSKLDVIDMSTEPDPPQIYPIYNGTMMGNIDISTEPDPPQIYPQYVRKNKQEIKYPTYQQSDAYMSIYNQMAVYNQNLNTQTRVYEELLNSGMTPY